MTNDNTHDSQTIHLTRQLIEASQEEAERRKRIWWRAVGWAGAMVVGGIVGSFLTGSNPLTTVAVSPGFFMAALCFSAAKEEATV